VGGVLSAPVQTAAPLPSLQLGPSSEDGLPGRIGLFASLFSAELAGATENDVSAPETLEPEIPIHDEPQDANDTGQSNAVAIGTLACTLPAVTPLSELSSPEMESAPVPKLSESLSSVGEEPIESGQTSSRAMFASVAFAAPSTIGSESDANDNDNDSGVPASRSLSTWEGKDDPGAFTASHSMPDVITSPPQQGREKGEMPGQSVVPANNLQSLSNHVCVENQAAPDDLHDGCVGHLQDSSVQVAQSVDTVSAEVVRVESSNATMKLAHEVPGKLDTPRAVIQNSTGRESENWFAPQKQNKAKSPISELPLEPKLAGCDAKAEQRRAPSEARNHTRREDGNPEQGPAAEVCNSVLPGTTRDEAVLPSSQPASAHLPGTVAHIVAAGAERGQPETSSGSHANIHNLEPASDPAEIPAYSPLNVTRIVERADSSEMHIGLRTLAFGSVEVHTVIRDSRVGLSLGSDRGDLRAMLAPDINGLQTILRQENLQLDTIQYTGHSANCDAGGGGSGNPHHFLNQRAAPSNNPQEECTTEFALADLNQSESDRLDLHA
jgi:hypothetical protein